MTLWDAIAAAAKELHPDRMEAAARAASLRDAAGFSLLVKNEGIPALSATAQAWIQEKEASGGEVASAFRTASRVSRNMRDEARAELVWSGPDTKIVPVRRTEQVILEMIRSATERLLFVSFVAYNIESLLEALREAMERGVQVSFLLEDPEAGHIKGDPMGLIKGALPKAKVYRWSPESRLDHGNGSVHAKCVLADGRAVFITSANLTNAAMERNMELGIKITGGAIPDQLQAHFGAMVATRMIRI